MATGMAASYGYNPVVTLCFSKLLLFIIATNFFIIKLVKNIQRL